METETRTAGRRGRGERELGLLLNGSRVSVPEGERRYGAGGGDGRTAV